MKTCAGICVLLFQPVMAMAMEMNRGGTSMPFECSDSALHEQRNLTPLHFAAHCGFDERVELLIAHHAHVNALDFEQATPLHKAARCGYVRIITMLIEHGALKDTQDIYGSTPLQIAARKGHLEAVRVLADAGADLNVGDKCGQTALFLAVREGHADIVDFLCSRDGVDLDACTTARETPLHGAVLEGHAAIVKRLLIAGASLECQNYLRQTSLDLAKAQVGYRHDYNPWIVTLLQQAGALSRPT